MSDSATELAAIKKTLGENPDVEFAVLVGSRAEDKAHKNSDWDIALWLVPTLKGMDRHGALVSVQLMLARALGISPEQIDIIDLHSAGLAMREQVVNAGHVLTGGDKLSWAHFQTRTWREIEEFHWNKRVYGY